MTARTTALQLAIKSGHNERPIETVARAGQYLAFLEGGAPEAANDLQAEEKPAADDGWINWAGGPCPVPENWKIKVQYRWESRAYAERHRASPPPSERWTHANCPGDIIAYKVVEAPADPFFAPETEKDAARVASVLDLVRQAAVEPSPLQAGDPVKYHGEVYRVVNGPTTWTTRRGELRNEVVVWQAGHGFLVLDVADVLRLA